MQVFVGDDWAEDHHDVVLMNEAGETLASKRLPEGIDGVARFHELVATYVEDPARVVIGIETDRGLWVEALLASGYEMYDINPYAASTYRSRHNVGGAKSDSSDAKMLADIVRTDRHNHRQIAGDSDLAGAIKLVARAHQNLIWERTRNTNRLRNNLLEFFPAALEAFDDLGSKDALAVLAKAPTPAQAARLSISQIRSALKLGGRQRNLDTKATEIQGLLRKPHLQASDPVAAAFGATTSSAVAIVAEINKQIAILEAELANSFRQHPDTDIYLSMPGLGVILGARVLGEFGDDPERYASAKSRRNYAGTSPLTKASGKKKAVMARYVRNRRLYDAIDQWAFCSITRSPGCRQFYDHRRAQGDGHHQALRALGNRLVGYLHRAIRTGDLYNEHTAWAHRQQPQTHAA